MTPEVLRELHGMGIAPKVYLAFLRSLHALGLSFGFYLGFLLALQIIFAAACAVVALMIFWRRSDHSVALFASLALVIFGMATFPNVIQVLPTENAAWWLPVTSVAFIGSVAFGLFLYLFPEGRFVPLWLRWAAVVWVAWQLPTYFFRGSVFDDRTWPVIFQFIAWLVFFGTVLYGQVYRYRYVSNPAQRQQTKWVVLGVTVALIGYFSAGVFSAVFLPGPTTLSPTGVLEAMSVVAIGYLFMLFIPLSLGIAILHHHLFDIDIIINRTLVYGSLTGILALVYQVCLIALQTLFVSVSGQTSFLANVISTVVIGALFEPLRRQLQQFVNRYIVRSQPQPATQ